MLMASVFAIFKKHAESLDLSFIGKNVVMAIEAGQNHLTKTVEGMAKIEVNDGQARNILSNIVSKGKLAGVSARTGYLINHNWQNPSEDEKRLGNTLFRLYNAATRLTRDIDRVGRFELSRRANLYLTGAFDLAARQPNSLSALLATPTELLEFDEITVTA